MRITRLQLVFIACILLVFYLALTAQLDTSTFLASPALLPQSHLQSPSFPVAPPVEKVDVYPLFPASSDPFDSTGEIFYITGTRQDTDDYLAYPVCSFTHVCLTQSSILFRWSNRTLYDRNSAIIADCTNKLRVKHYAYDLCYCFYPPELKASVLSFDTIKSDSDQSVLLKWRRNSKRAGRPLSTTESIGPAGSVPNIAYQSQLPFHQQHYHHYTNDKQSLYQAPESLPSTVSPPIYAGHYWTFHKYIATKHQIGHWAQRIMIFASAMQHFLSLPLPTLDGIIIQDTSAPLHQHEESMLNNALWSILTHANHPNIQHLLTDRQAATANKQVITLEMIEAAEKRGQPVCVERLSWIKAFGIFATNTHDTMPYRAVAYKRYGLTGLSHRCPPRQITLLTRGNRKILNSQEIVDYVKERYKRDVRIVDIDAHTSARDQITVFATSGLLLASHSSQLVNVMFSHPRASMVEIAPEYYNSDFSEYAHSMGVFFRYALGGSANNDASKASFDPVTENTVDATMKDCIELLNECEGDSHCILIKRFEPVCKRRKACCKYSAGFYANMTAVKTALTHAINHLNWACGEHW